MADYSAQLAAIDAAITAGAAEPLMLSDAHGQQITYRGMDELIRARKHYQSLQHSQGTIRQGMRIGFFRPGAPR